MAQQKDSGQQLINLLLIGLGAYLVWEYILSPMLSSAQTTATATNCYDQNGNPIACPSGVPAGTVINTTGAALICYDQNGNPLTCPAGVAAGTVLAGTQTTPTPTPTTQNATQNTPTIQRTSTGAPASRISSVQSAIRVAAAQRLAALQSGRSTTSGGGALPPGGVHGIVPSWQASGGPAFNAFTPGGMTFGGGAGAFSQPSWGTFETPLSKLVQ